MFADAAARRVVTAAHAADMLRHAAQVIDVLLRVLATCFLVYLVGGMMVPTAARAARRAAGAQGVLEEERIRARRGVDPLDEFPVLLDEFPDVEVGHGKVHRGVDLPPRVPAEALQVDDEHPRRLVDPHPLRDALRALAILALVVLDIERLAVSKLPEAVGKRDLCEGDGYWG